MGGWKLDDVRLVSLPSSDTDSLVLSGDTNGVVGGAVSFQISSAAGLAPYWIYYSLSHAGTLIQGQSFCIGAPYFTATTGTTSAAGAASWTSTPLPPKAGGKTVYVEARWM